VCCFLGVFGFPDFSSSSSEKNTKSSSGVETEFNLLERFLGTEELEAGMWAMAPRLKIGDGVREEVLDDKLMVGPQDKGVDPLEPLALGERDP